MVIDDVRTTEEWEKLLGAQVRRSRLLQDVDQLTLAREANVSVGALRNLESGSGSTLRTLIRVVRALGEQEWLEDLEPQLEVSPLQLARAEQRRREPQRASRTRNRS